MGYGENMREFIGGPKGTASVKKVCTMGMYSETKDCLDVMDAHATER